jgi:DNA-binding MarR family transcriptional regulator
MTSDSARPADEPTLARVRDLLGRKDWTAERYRALVGRALRLSEMEARAVAHVAAVGQVTPGELARRLVLTSGGCTALIRRLETAGHLVRRAHPVDGRTSLLALAPDTVRRAGECYAPLVAALDGAIERLSPEERGVVERLLAEVVAATESRTEELIAGEADNPGAARTRPGLWA